MTIKELVNLPTVTIIDVSPAADYAIEHIDKALNIPLNALGINIESLKRMSKPIVIYCKTGNCSQTAVLQLRDSGVTEVYNGGSLGDMKVIKDADCGCGINM